MIIDSHVHVWVQDPKKYPWVPIGGYVPDTDAPIEELLETLNLNGVDKAVLVQPTPYGWNNNYLLDAVKFDPEKFRSVCLVDPMSADHIEKMHSLVDVQSVSGFRLNWNLYPPTAWMDSDNHSSFWKTAGDLKRPLCIQCTLEYIPLLKTMCKRNREVLVVVDHMGRLITENSPHDRGFQNLLSLSQYPNIYMKISGFYYCSQQLQPYNDLVPFIERILDSFGAQRCLWGSDFPFIQQHWSYSGLLEFFNQTNLWSESELEWLMGRTAQELWWNQPVN